jgi:glycosyltransferase involved in cell wall biosynthesis
MNDLRYKRSLRVLHGPIGALYQPSLFVLGLRELGMSVDLMRSDDSFMGYSFKVPDAIILDGSGIASTSLMDFMLYAIRTYDVFHFHSGYTLLPWDYFAGDLRLLKKLGKVIFMSRWGCRDGRTPSDFLKERGLCRVCPMYGKSCSDEIIEKRLRVEEKYADVIINHEYDFQGFNQSAIFLHGSIDLEFWKPDLEIPEKFRYPTKSTNETRILHSVGGNERGDVKGTTVINQTIEKLRRAGFKIDYQIVSGISFKDLRFHILQVDVVIDQLRYGSFGSFARESLSLGKPVIGHVLKSQRDNLPGLPIIEATTNNVEKVLVELLKQPEKIPDIGKRSRRYAEKHFDYRKITARLKNLYEEAKENNYKAENEAVFC